MNFFNIILLNLCIFNTVYSLEVVPTDINIDYIFDIPTNTYHKFCKNVYSQGGEDGILEQLIKELEIKKGTFCEFGASDGIDISNTYNLIKNHFFSGIAIELDQSRYLKCVENYKFYPNVQVFHGAVLYNDPDNDLDAWLKKGKMPWDIDVLSIDIDGDDYYVWEKLTNFKPKIVILEINPYRDPIYEELPGHPSQEYNIDLLQQWEQGRVAVGCSFISAVKLGLSKGYIPVAFTGNLIFIRNDLVHTLHEFPFIISDNAYDYIGLYSHVVKLADNKWHTNTGLILNAAIRDYYLTFKKKHIDINWLNIQMKQLLING